MCKEAELDGQPSPPEDRQAVELDVWVLEDEIYVGWGTASPSQSGVVS